MKILLIDKDEIITSPNINTIEDVTADHVKDNHSLWNADRVIYINNGKFKILKDRTSEELINIILTIKYLYAYI